MILTVNIHPTAIKVARSGQGGRNVALEMTDATGGTVASIFPGGADGWDRLVSLAIEGRAMQEQADTDHAIAADVDERIRRDGEALGRRVAADEGIEPEEAAYRCPDCGRASCTGEDCYWPDEAGIERPARPEALDDDEPPSRVPWPTGLCGHPVQPGAWAAGFHYCRDCTASSIRHRFDEAAAPDLTVVDTPARPEDLDDADGPKACGARHNAYFCTLEAGHPGQHVSNSTHGHELCTWPQDGPQ